MLAGIDLGTSNSVIAISKDGEDIKVVPNPQGKFTTPSIVRVADDGSVQVGNEVQMAYNLGSPKTKGSFKVDMGSAADYKVNTERMTPVELSAQVLKYLKNYAEEFAGEKIEEAVITVPAYFNELQRQKTQQAAESIGLKVARMINEPTASALALGITLDEEKTVLVYDLGGGTFDVSILSVDSGMVETLNTKGDSSLGGDDLDTAMASVIKSTLARKADYFPKTTEVDRAIRTLAKMAKEQLTDNEVVTIDLSPLKQLDPEFDSPFMSIDITRDQAFKVYLPLLQRTVDILKSSIDDLDGSIEIDEVILTGGSTKLFCLADYVASQTGLKVTQGKVDPDLSIAIGACIQHSIIKGSNQMLLLDVTPLDLSIELDGGLCSTVIRRNSNIPIKMKQMYTTHIDYLEQLEFNIVQGNSPVASENTSLGTLYLIFETPMPAGIPNIEVTFELNASGNLTVTAEDLATGNKVNVKRSINVESEGK